MGKYFSDIQIRRPLVFLCGPFVNDDDFRDRRNILQKYISSNHKQKDEQENIYQPIPIIIDKILNSDYIISNKLSLWLIEEMIASISFKTYIFLDTMSTSAELGLFSNSSTGNKITIFIPTKKIVHIGSFIKEDLINNKQAICVEYESQNIEIPKNGRDDINHHEAYFTDDLIPLSIKTSVDQDMHSIFFERSSTSLIATHNVRSVTNINYIDFEIVDNRIICRLKFKLFFYLVTTVLKSKYRSLNVRDITEEMILFVVNQVEDEIFSIFLNHPGLDELATSRARLVIKRPQIEIETEIHSSTRNLIVNILHLVKLIEQVNEGYWNSVKVVDADSLTKGNRVKKSYQDFLFKDLFRLSIDDEQLMKSYNYNPKKYLYKFHITQHGKTKLIMTYKNDQYGRSLRKLHEKLNKVLTDIIPTANTSFAYKKGKSIMDCFPIHKDSTFFYKVDVEKFFDSIRISKLIKVFRCYFSEFPEQNYQNQFRNDFIGLTRNSMNINDREITYYDFDFVYLWELLGVTFYNGKLPIGFITSPKISDLYMYFLDRKLEEQKSSVSRYADDILLSDVSEVKLEEIYLWLVTELKILGLKVNVVKSRKKQFKVSGDSMRFLGINIVSSPEGNRLTISRKDLLDIVRDYDQFLRRKNVKNFHIVKGRISYVKYVCPQSYKKLSRMIQIRTNTNLETFMTMQF